MSYWATICIDLKYTTVMPCKLWLEGKWSSALAFSAKESKIPKNVKVPVNLDFVSQQSSHLKNTKRVNHLQTNKEGNIE